MHKATCSKEVAITVLQLLATYCSPTLMTIQQSR